MGGLLSSASDEDTQFRQFLVQTPFLKDISFDHRVKVIRAAERVRFAAGEPIVSQGEEGEAFFIIMSGLARITIDGQDRKVVLEAHDYFGEGALLSGSGHIRTATITASADVVCARVSREVFDEHLGGFFHCNTRKVVIGSDDKVKTEPPSPKTAEERRLIGKAIRQNPNLANIMDLQDHHINQFIDAAWKEEVVAGTLLIKQGNFDADYFYIVQAGSFEAFIEPTVGNSIAAAMEVESVARVLGPGESFGELALLYCAQRTASVKALTNSVVWVLDRGSFKDILAKTADDLAMDHMVYLDRVSILDPVPYEGKQVLARALTEMMFYKGQAVFEQGEVGETFYILFEGEVSVVEDGKVVNKIRATRDKAQFFGERALLDGSKRTATVNVLSDRAQALMLDRDSFTHLLGPLEELHNPQKKNKDEEDAADALKALEELHANAKDSIEGGDGGDFGEFVQMDPEEVDEHDFSTTAFQSIREGAILSKDLEMVAMLGCGTFAAVQLVEHKETKQVYALKSVSKGYVMQTHSKNQILNEKKVHMMCNSPFIVKLYETYNDSQFIRFLVEPALGGQLRNIYQKEKLTGSAEHAKYYTATAVYALQSLHRQRIVYRDLKPENMMLNDKGHCKLIDMGLAKVVIGKTNTLCGIPDYFAPEMVRCHGHGLGLDWWTLGILIYELMAGEPPFHAPTVVRTWERVLQGFDVVTFPTSMDNDCADLIKALCRLDPAERLPMTRGGIANFTDQRWMSGFDWNGLQSLSLTPPFIPSLKGPKDHSQFDVAEGSLPLAISFKDLSGWDRGFGTSI